MVFAVIGSASVMYTEALCLIRQMQHTISVGLQANQETASVLRSQWSAAERYVHGMLHKPER